MRSEGFYVNEKSSEAQHLNQCAAAVTRGKETSIKYSEYVSVFSGSRSETPGKF